MKIVVGDRNLFPHRELFESRLPDGASVSWHPVFGEQAVIADLPDADVYAGGKFTAAMAAAAGRLRLIHVAGAGYDNVSLSDVSSTTQVANTFHHEGSIAEYIVATAILLRRGFLTQDAALRQGIWATSVYDDTIDQPRTLRDARIGFVGFGHIGAQSWSVLRALGATGCAVTGSGSVDADEHGLAWVGDTGALARLLDESDVVVVSAPLNERTRGMIGRDELTRIGSAGVLINVGRGPLIDEHALYQALSDNVIAAAAVDVWYDYPSPDGVGRPSELPFSELPNLVMTPHSSGVTRDTFVGRVGDITDNITRLADGEKLLRVVYPRG
ncbi:2-hydroxyacid dehydrogenase [Williamsia sp.]|uniref:2-hydroxyacid dehydrogenase n=1 Tax=Williamsia sp. TaxID=1872085 RepID=UPI001A2BECC2|nr:2-hydroxyacid dehydrogenase [Williamsia sp.]MBJ7289227.1 hydroxyacid dehydrogenase [Williamsia sp.]